MIKDTNMSKPLLIIPKFAGRLMGVKSILVAIALAFVSTSLFAEDWTTTDGIKYQDVKVVRVEDDAVTILYKDGGALVFLNKLPPALQDRFDYDPVRAKAAAEARAKADADNAVLLQAEIVKAEALKRKTQIDEANAMSTNAPTK
jgi:hypothetical protein